MLNLERTPSGVLGTGDRLSEFELSAGNVGRLSDTFRTRCALGRMSAGTPLIAGAGRGDDDILLGSTPNQVTDGCGSMSRPESIHLSIPERSPSPPSIASLLAAPGERRAFLAEGSVRPPPPPKLLAADGAFGASHIM
jgi:hypothetical protein